MKPDPFTDSDSYLAYRLANTGDLKNGDRARGGSAGPLVAGAIAVIVLVFIIAVTMR